MNKARALEKVAKSLYKYDDETILSSSDSSFTVLTKLAGAFNAFRWIFDFTASENTFQSLVKNNDIQNVNICSAHISDEGNIGVMFLEGPERNPRIDDLQAILYAQSNSKEYIKDWLCREVALTDTDKKIIKVGIGCNSETTVLADEVISSHAAYFAKNIKHISVSEYPSKYGRILLSRFDYSSEVNIFTETIAVQPMKVVNAINDYTWDIRIMPEVLYVMKSQMGLAMPDETGGVLIGCVNYKTKTIHVTDIITAPPDSKADQVCFYRGTQGLPESVQIINENSGNQLGYVGEWHTHPHGPDGMSGTDANSVRKFKKEFQSLQSPLPVFLMILTPNVLLPFVY